MKFSFRYSLPLLLATSTGLLSCKKDAPALGTGLIGTWKLTQRQCYCPQAPVPNELVVFTATRFSFYKNNSLASSGTYADTTASICGTTPPAPALRLTYFSSSQLPQSFSVAASISGNTLVLDHGGCLDAPVDTYERQR